MSCAIQSPLSKMREVFPARSAEFELLLACCNDREDLSRFFGEVDWKQVLSLADRHGLVAFLHQALAAHSAEVPLWKQIAEHADVATRRALWLTQLLQRVLACLQTRGIAALPYKGPVLAQMIYGNVAFRQYTDLDIFIPAADLVHAKAALAEIGLRAHVELSPAAERTYVSSGYELTFDGFGNRNLVELQWRVVPKFYSVDFDIDLLFDRARPLDLHGMEVRTLCPEDLFLVLCVHAAKHLWARLSWIHEIGRLTGLPEIKWDEVTKAADGFGIRRIVAVTLLLAEWLFSQPLPPDVQPLLQDGDAAQASQRILGMLVGARQPDPESFAYFREMMRLRERRSDQLRFLLRLATTPSTGEWEAVRLPGPLFPLYRVVRLARLMRKLAPR